MIFYLRRYKFVKDILINRLVVKQNNKPKEFMYISFGEINS